MMDNGSAQRQAQDQAMRHSPCVIFGTVHTIDYGEAQVTVEYGLGIYPSVRIGDAVVMAVVVTPDYLDTADKAIEVTRVQAIRDANGKADRRAR